LDTNLAPSFSKPAGVNTSKAAAHRSLNSATKDSLVKSENNDVQKKEYENSEAKNQEHIVKTIVE